MSEMQIIAVDINKGGVGKTTVTKCLSTATAYTGLT
jgi:MinD-like ATPase involved in chromosome partitioning or flagellar assembly